MKKLNYMGIGPIIGAVALPWLAVAIFLTQRYPGSFAILSNASAILFYAGIFLLLSGAAFYLLTIPPLLKGLKNTRLITTGTFALCCNPLYASVILMIIPGIALMMNSWLVLSVSIVAYILFRIFIRKEYAEMEDFFGEEYRKYRLQTPSFFPFTYIRKSAKPGNAKNQ